LFKISNEELIIGDGIWVFKLDLLATSVLEITHPKYYIYKGKYSDDMTEYILLTNNGYELKIPVTIYFTHLETGNYILRSSRQDIIYILKNILKNTTCDMSCRFLTREYLKTIEKDFPEWLV